ncbi:MAG: hypothetical protein JXA21_09835, partial [Anaerolineae bacterium]|nr:hypothetical protein [Anaerolineae bacterium]
RRRQRAGPVADRRRGRRARRAGAPADHHLRVVERYRLAHAHRSHHRPARRAGRRRGRPQRRRSRRGLRPRYGRRPDRHDRQRTLLQRLRWRSLERAGPPDRRRDTRRRPRAGLRRRRDAAPALAARRGPRRAHRRVGSRRRRPHPGRRDAGRLPGIRADPRPRRQPGGDLVTD